MCITRAKDINHSAFDHCPLACFGFEMINKQKQTKTKEWSWLNRSCMNDTRMHRNKSHNRHLCVHAVGPLDLIFLVLTGCHLYSGHVLHCVSPWSNSWRQLLELRLRFTPLFMTCMCQSSSMHAALAVQRCATLCMTPLLISAFHHTPLTQSRDASWGRISLLSLFLTGVNPQTDVQTSQP